MARIFVMSDNLTTRVEIVDADDAEEFGMSAFCAGCGRGETERVDLLADERQRFHLEDAIEEVAAPYADCCRNCADDDCLIPTSHERGHRCRKI